MSKNQKESAAQTAPKTAPEVVPETPEQRDKRIQENIEAWTELAREKDDDENETGEIIAWWSMFPELEIFLEDMQYFHPDQDCWVVGPTKTLKGNTPNLRGDAGFYTTKEAAHEARETYRRGSTNKMNLYISETTVLDACCGGSAEGWEIRNGFGVKVEEGFDY